MPQKEARLRFYEELNNFLIPANRKKTFPYRFWGTPSVKDVIESLGIPHTEVDLILINGCSVNFKHHLADGDRMAVYPVFESLDIANLSHLRETPLRKTRFILDVHLGKTARSLRMLGFDVLYQNDYADPEIVFVATTQKRIILTRDRGILKYKKVTHGYLIRSDDPKKQVVEVLDRFDLFSQIKPFHRCIACNGLILKIDKNSVESRLKPKTKQYYNEFFQCENCNKVFWKGSHYKNMLGQIDELLNRTLQSESSSN
jgi:uncharacterized protein